MSCGNPHELDCGEALAHLYEFIDGEVAPTDHERIAEHLHECWPCLQEFDVERLVKALVARSCADHAPEQLRAKVVSQLAVTRIRWEQPPAQ
jgi:anti-sigma factor (TIGR02949 family)